MLHLPSLLFLRLLWQKIWDVSSSCPPSQGRLFKKIWFTKLLFKAPLLHRWIHYWGREVRFTCILLGKVDVAEHPFKRYKVIKTHHDLSARLCLTGLRRVWCRRWQPNTNTQGLERLGTEEATREHDPWYFDELKGGVEACWVQTGFDFQKQGDVTRPCRDDTLGNVSRKILGIKPQLDPFLWLDKSVWGQCVISTRSPPPHPPPTPHSATQRSTRFICFNEHQIVSLAAPSSFPPQRKHNNPGMKSKKPKRLLLCRCAPLIKEWAGCK